MYMLSLEVMILILVCWVFFFFSGQVKVFRALYTFEPRTVSISRFQGFEKLNFNFVYNSISSVLLGLAY